MKISKLALIALLGGALMAFGCGSDSNNNGTGGDPGTGGVGGDGGMGGDAGMGGDGGMGGDAGTGGTGGLPDTGVYGFTCTLSGLPIPLPVTIIIDTADADPPLAESQASTLTTQLTYIVAPAVIDLLPSLAPDAVISELECGVGVTNSNISVIAHSADGLPIAPMPEFDSDVVESIVEPGEGAGTVDLSIESFTTLITGLPEALVPGGEISLTAGEGDCGALEGDPLALPVAAPAQ